MVRPYVRPGPPLLNAQESRILGWMRLGGGLWAASQLCDVPLARVEEWLEFGQEHPRGMHSAFAREVRSLNGANGAHPVPTGNIIGKIVQGPNGQDAASRLITFEDRLVEKKPIGELESRSSGLLSSTMNIYVAINTTSAKFLAALKIFSILNYNNDWD